MQRWRSEGVMLQSPHTCEEREVVVVVVAVAAVVGPPPQEWALVSLTAGKWWLA